jgi:hypothetical protein
MSHIAKALLAVTLLGAVTLRAAEPEFKIGIVTASRVYQRESTTFSVAGVAAAGKRVEVSRVTVALEGLLVTGEWEPKTLSSTSANDFRRGREVPAALSRNRLLLKSPDGDVVTAKVVKREKRASGGADGEGD